MGLFVFLIDAIRLFWGAQEGFEDLIANDEEVEAAAEENQQLYQRREAELQRRDNEMSDEQLEEFVRKRFENRSYEVRYRVAEP